jgi:hypothetical protein
MTRDKREYYYKHDRLTAEQERQNEALVELILQQQEEERKHACQMKSLNEPR